MISFPLLLLILAIVALSCMAMGYRAGFSAGHDVGWDEGHDFASTDNEVKWRITAKGAEMLAAAEAPTLSIHPKFQSQQKNA